MERLPIVETVAELEALRAEPARWRPSVAALARTLGIAPVPLVDLGGGNLVVGAGADHVVKLAPPVFAREIAAEVDALERVAGALPIATPRLVDAGARDGWSYVVMTRLPGRPLSACWDEVPAAALPGLLRAMGAVLAALHALPTPSEGPLAVDWAGFVAAESVACVARQARWGVPPHLVEGIPRALARADVGSPCELRLLHGDLHGGNLLVAPGPAGCAPTGVIDLGDAQAGDPLLDLVTPALLCARGRAPLLGALLDGYGLEPASRGPALRARLLAYAVLHRFNDLTRYLGWAPEPPASLDELGEVLFPF